MAPLDQHQTPGSFPEAADRPQAWADFSIQLQQRTPLLIPAGIRWLLRQTNRGSATIYIYATPPRPTFVGLTCVR